MSAPWGGAGGGGPLRRPRPACGDAGHALLTALFVMLLVGLAMAIAAAALQLHMRTMRHEVRTVRLIALTDAAVAETLAELDADPAFPGLAAHDFGGGVVGSRVTSSSRTQREVTGWARYRGMVRVVRVQVSFEADGGMVIWGFQRLPESSLIEPSP